MNRMMHTAIFRKQLRYGNGDGDGDGDGDERYIQPTQLHRLLRRTIATFVEDNRPTKYLKLVPLETGPSTIPATIVIEVEMETVMEMVIVMLMLCIHEDSAHWLHTWMR